MTNEIGTQEDLLYGIKELAHEAVDKHNQGLDNKEELSNLEILKDIYIERSIEEDTLYCVNCLASKWEAPLEDVLDFFDAIPEAVVDFNDNTVYYPEDFIDWDWVVLGENGEQFVTATGFLSLYELFTDDSEPLDFILGLPRVVACVETDKQYVLVNPNA